MIGEQGMAAQTVTVGASGKCEPQPRGDGTAVVLGNSCSNSVVITIGENIFNVSVKWLVRYVHGSLI